jgi:hypothetical protein
MEITIAQALLIIGGIGLYIYHPSLITAIFGMITIIYILPIIMVNPFIAIGFILLFIIYLYGVARVISLRIKNGG